MQVDYSFDVIYLKKVAYYLFKKINLNYPVFKDTLTNMFSETVWKLFRNRWETVCQHVFHVCQLFKQQRNIHFLDRYYFGFLNHRPIVKIFVFYQECASFYGDGYFSADEDGDDKYCRWCGQGGTLYLCSSCSCAFCKVFSTLWIVY